MRRKLRNVILRRLQRIELKVHTQKSQVAVNTKAREGAYLYQFETGWPASAEKASEADRTDHQIQAVRMHLTMITPESIAESEPLDCPPNHSGELSINIALPGRTKVKQNRQTRAVNAAPKSKAAGKPATVGEFKKWNEVVLDKPPEETSVAHHQASKGSSDVGDGNASVAVGALNQPSDSSGGPEWLSLYRSRGVGAEWGIHINGPALDRAVSGCLAALPRAGFADHSEQLTCATRIVFGTAFEYAKYQARVELTLEMIEADQSSTVFKALVLKQGAEHSKVVESRLPQDEVSLELKLLKEQIDKGKLPAGSASLKEQFLFSESTQIALATWCGRQAAIASISSLGSAQPANFNDAVLAVIDGWLDSMPCPHFLWRAGSYDVFGQGDSTWNYFAAQIVGLCGKNKMGLCVVSEQVLSMVDGRRESPISIGSVPVRLIGPSSIINQLRTKLGT